MLTIATRSDRASSACLAVRNIAPTLTSSINRPKPIRDLCHAGGNCIGVGQIKAGDKLALGDVGLTDMPDGAAIITWKLESS